MAKKQHSDDPADDVVAGALDVLGKKDLPEPEHDVVDGDVVDAEPVAPERDVPDDLTFTTKQKDPGPDAGEVLEIELDGVKLYARKPSKGAWSLIVGAVSRSANQADRTQAILEFVFTAFDPAGQILIKNRMFDSSDDFDVDDVSTIVTKLIEKWAPNQSRAQRREAMRAGNRR